MELSDEQKERIKRNRERALEIQRKRKQEKESVLSSSHGDRTGEGTVDRIASTSLEGGQAVREHSLRGDVNEADNDEDEGEKEELEEFEVNASAFVTKKEAMQMYCLPEGTLAVCSFKEKENPHRKGWKPMKLYNRNEIRRRARKRFGGLEGLVAERKRRAEKRFRKDLERTKDIFK